MRLLDHYRQFDDIPDEELRAAWRSGADRRRHDAQTIEAARGSSAAPGRAQTTERIVRVRNASSARGDTAQNGGLFVGRPRGVGTTYFRRPATPSPEPVRRRDAVVAALLAATIVVLVLLFWGPIPLGWLWLMSQVPAFAQHSFTGLLAAFAGILATYAAGLVALRHLDRLWILARRAAGVDQHEGILGRVFVVATIIGVAAFSIWLILLGGLTSSLMNNSA